MNLDRLERLINQENIEKIKNTKILIIGLGGVGGYALESLVRSGIQKITIVDSDIIDETNINRQLICLNNNIGLYKTEEWKKRLELINKDIEIELITEFINEETKDKLFLKEYHYIIDACDTLNTKLLIIEESLKRNIKFITSLGMGNRIDASKVIITDLSKTFDDPLAKKLRELVRKKNIKAKIPVVFSKEKPIIKNKIIGSTSYVPGTAGLLITSYIINDIIKDLN